MNPTILLPAMSRLRSLVFIWQPVKEKENTEFKHAQLRLKIEGFGHRPIGIMVKVFTNSLGDRDSIPGQVIPKTHKMTLDATLLNTLLDTDQG